MENHRKRPPAAHDAEPDDEPEACPEPWRGEDEEALPAAWRNWDPADPDAIAPWDDPADPDAEPIPEPFIPPLHPPEFPGLAAGGVIPEPAISGFYYLSGAPVPPTHPDHGPMHLLPRKPDGGFAAY